MLQSSSNKTKGEEIKRYKNIVIQKFFLYNPYVPKSNFQLNCGLPHNLTNNSGGPHEVYEKNQPSETRYWLQ